MSGKNRSTAGSDEGSRAPSSLAFGSSPQARRLLSLLQRLDAREGPLLGSHLSQQPTDAALAVAAPCMLMALRNSSRVGGDQNSTATTALPFTLRLPSLLLHLDGLEDHSRVANHARKLQGGL